MKAVIYARYSSSHQKETSIEDQVRICRERAEKDGWSITECYKDLAISGASVLLRDGMQKLLQDAMARKFDVVISEALDRLSRDQADIANLFKQLQFHGIKLITLAEGEVDELHVGLKGTMNALFLKDLANKTRRGLRGRIEAGKSGGGICYGYDVVKAFAPDGTPIRGDRTINQDKVKIIKRIFKEYSIGRSPKAIAISLNKDRIIGPSGKDWGPSSINGNRERGTGIINNELYIGRLVWNRLTYLKNPNTGRRNSRLNPKSEWIIKEVPSLRIINQELWDKAKTRQKSLDNLKAYNNYKSSYARKRRPVYLFSGLTKCSCCGGGYTKISKDLLGCYNARSKGICDNRQNIRQDELERRVIKAIKSNLMDPKLFTEFCTEYTRYMNKLRIEYNSTLNAQKREFEAVDKELDKLVDALCKGVPAEKVKDRMIELEDRWKELKNILEADNKPVVLLHPKMSITYQAKLDKLFAALSDEQLKDEASGVIRSLIDKIILSPSEGKTMGITLVGDLAGLLSVATKTKNPLPENDILLVQVKMVAGVGFEPTTFRL